MSLSDDRRSDYDPAPAADSDSQQKPGAGSEGGQPPHVGQPGVWPVSLQPDPEDAIVISPSPVATGQESQGEVEAPVEAAEGSSLAPVLPLES